MHHIDGAEGLQGRHACRVSRRTPSCPFCRNDLDRQRRHDRRIYSQWMPPPKSPARPSRPAGGAPAPQAYQPGPRWRPMGEAYCPLQAAPVGDRKEASPPASRSSCALPCPACPRAPTGARRTRGPAWRGRQRFLGDLSPHAGGQPCRGASRERAAPKGPSRGRGCAPRRATCATHPAPVGGRFGACLFRHGTVRPGASEAPGALRGPGARAIPAPAAAVPYRAHRQSGACAHEI